ncbi:hypothetical protein [Streptomyces sp. NPDC047097]
MSAVTRRIQQVTGHQPVTLDLAWDPTGPVHAAPTCPPHAPRSRRDAHRR